MADAEVTITHAFVSTKSDGADTTKVKPSDWNAALIGAGGDDGEVVTFDSTFDSGLGAHRRAQVLSAQHTTVGNVGGGSDTLMSYVLPAATLGSSDRMVSISGAGRTSATGSAKTLVVLVGAAAYVLNPVTTNPSGSNWRAEVTLTRLTATTQRLTGWCSVGSQMQTTLIESPVENLASAVTLAFAATDGGSVTDAIRQDEMIVTLLN